MVIEQRPSQHVQGQLSRLNIVVATLRVFPNLTTSPDRHIVVIFTGLFREGLLPFNENEHQRYYGVLVVMLGTTLTEEESKQH